MATESADKEWARDARLYNPDEDFLYHVPSSLDDLDDDLNALWIGKSRRQVANKDKEESAVRSAPVRPVIGEEWRTRADALQRYYATQAAVQRKARVVRQRISISCDPVRDQAQTAGDIRHQRFLKTLDSYGVKRSADQLRFHKAFMQASLPWIHGRDWETNSSRILEEQGLYKLNPYVLCLTPRRFGKTWSIGMYVAACLLNIPGIIVACFSTAGRASTFVQEYTIKFLTAAGGAGRICKCKDEHLAVASSQVDGSTSSANARVRANARDTAHFYSYPSSVNSKCLRTGLGLCFVATNRSRRRRHASLAPATCRSQTRCP